MPTLNQHLWEGYFQAVDSRLLTNKEFYLRVEIHHSPSFVLELHIFCKKRKKVIVRRGESYIPRTLLIYQRHLQRN
jgi:hypothetical protein